MENEKHKGMGKMFAKSYYKKLLITVLSAALLTSCSPQKKSGVSISVSNWVGTKDDLEIKDLSFFYEKYGTDKYNIEIDDWQYDVEAFMMKAATGQLPTIYEAYFTDIERIKNSGYGTDITDYFTRNGYAELLNDQIIDLISKDGRIYAVPSKAYVLGTVFNADIFRRAGLQRADGSYAIPGDLNELVETARIIKERTGVSGFLIQADGNTGGWIFTNIAWEFGVRFIDKDTNGRWIATFDTPECVEALQWIKDLKWKYDILPDNPFTNQKQSLALLAAGQCAMLIDDPLGSINEMIEDYGVKKDDIGAFAIPAGNTGKIALMGGNIQSINNSANDEQLDVAFRLMEETVLPKTELDDTVRSHIEQGYINTVEKDQFVGIRTIDMWGDNAETRFRRELTEKYANVDENLYIDYNSCIDSPNCEIRLEEPVCCQDLYRILTECIREVLENENTDPAELIRAASYEFQREYLDKLN